jgi:peroxiredoxin
MPAPCNVVVSVAVALAATLGAQAPRIGETAPPIAPASWLSGGGAPPSPQSLKGRVVVVEFFGTWCPPSVQVVPVVQRLHLRYGTRGVTVLAVSFEDAAVLQPFLQKHGCTMAVGSDPERKVAAAYGVERWPTTVVIDEKGKLAYVGNPYAAESAIEKALAIDPGAGSLLTMALDAQKELNKDKRREAFARLVLKAPDDFDLQAWALGHAEYEQLPPPGAGRPAPVSAADAAARPQPGAAAAQGFDAADVLTRCAAAWQEKDPAPRRPLVQQLAKDAPKSFDLARWSRETIARLHPLETREVATLLAQSRHDELLQAIVTRNPEPAALSAAAKNGRLATYSRKMEGVMRVLGKQGIMVANWVFSGTRPNDYDRFWKELDSDGTTTSPETKQLHAVILDDGSHVTRGLAAPFARDHLAKALVMGALAKNQVPRVADLEKAVAEEWAKLEGPLVEIYGAPAKTGR